jgi:DNA replication protein
MAQRRMFSKKITETDNFLDMPLSSQALYFHLNMGADDEGFIDKAKTIQRTIGASSDDLRILIAKGFVIPFDSGVVVIRHWRIHNYIRSDRFQSTMHQEEKKKIDFDETKIANIKAFQDVIPDVIPNGYQMDTQVRIGKVRLDKVRLDKVNNHNYTEVDDVELSVPIKKKPLSQILKESDIKINDRQSQILIEYIGLDNMTVDMIQYAFELTEDAGANNFNYLNKILKSWKEKGFTSLEEAQADNRDHKQGNKSSATGNIPDWSSEHPKNQKKEEERILTKEEFLALDEYD